MTDLQFKALSFLVGANSRTCEEIFAHLWPEHRFLKHDPGSAKGGPSRIQFVVNHYMGKLEKKGWVVKPWLSREERYSQDFSLTTAGVLAFRKERDSRILE